MKYYENGQTMEKISYKDEQKDGLHEVYHENGQLKRKRNYKDGNEISSTTFQYYENDQLEIMENYKDGKEDGLSEGYLEDGSLEEGYPKCYQNGEEVDQSICKQ